MNISTEERLKCFIIAGGSVKVLTAPGDSIFLGGSLPGSKAYSSNLGSNTVIFSSSHYVTTLYRVLRGTSPSFWGHSIFFLGGGYLCHSIFNPNWQNQAKVDLDMLKNWYYNHWGVIKVKDWAVDLVFLWYPDVKLVILPQESTNSGHHPAFQYDHSSGSKYLGQSCSGKSAVVCLDGADTIITTEQLGCIW